MMEIEQAGGHDNASGSCWCKHHLQPQWLLSTLSEIDQSTTEMMSIMQHDDGETFAQRAEMYYQRRPDLLRRLGYLRHSFHTLSSSLNAAAATDRIRHRRHSSVHTLESTSDNRHSSSTTTTTTDELGSSSISAKEEEGEEEEEEGEAAANADEVTRVLGELVRRNAEKREAKRELEEKVERLERENSDLRMRLEHDGRKMAAMMADLHGGGGFVERRGGTATVVDCSICSGLGWRHRRRSSPVQKIKQLLHGGNLAAPN